jgi:hypothetical protein
MYLIYYIYTNLYYLFLFYIIKFYILEKLGKKTVKERSLIYPVAAHGPCHMILWHPQAPQAQPPLLSCCLFVSHVHVIQTNNKTSQANLNLNDDNSNDSQQGKDSDEGGQRRRRMVTRDGPGDGWGSRRVCSSPRCAFF